MSRVPPTAVSKVERARRGRDPGPLHLAFTRAVQDWYYGLIPFAALNFVWLFCVLTVVAGPPATAAMLGVARDAAIGQGAEPSNFWFYLRHFFWRAWKLGLITALGSIILVVDLGFYADALAGNLLLLYVGITFLLYVLLVWLEFVLLAWPLLVNQPEMPIRHVLRNAAILTLRVPGANLGLALLVLLLCLLSFLIAIIASLALAAFVSLLVQHYLHLQAPVLAHWPPRPGEAARPVEAPE